MDKENVSPNVSYNTNQTSDTINLVKPEDLEQFQWDDVNKLFNFENTDYITKLDEQLAQTRSQRVRAALYPESNENFNNANIPSTQFDPNKPTSVQILAECSQVSSNDSSNDSYKIRILICSFVCLMINLCFFSN